MKTVLINQPAGLGDLLFCQKIGYHFLTKGHRVIWPVIPQYDSTRHYLKNFEFPSVYDPYDGCFFFNYCRNSVVLNVSENNEFIYIPLDGQYTGGGILSDKYKLLGLDYSDWVNYLNINRNHTKENQLFELLGLKEDSKYCLHNPWFASPPHSLKMRNVPQTSLPIIEMRTIDGFCLFDWLKVVEYASEFFVTDSSLTLLIEYLAPKLHANKFTITLRQSDPSVISLMYKLNWNYIQGEF